MTTPIFTSDESLTSSSSSSVSSFFSETFCSGSEPLLDYSLLWNASSPVFSRCFLSTVPVWAPATFLSVLAPFEVYVLSRGIGDSVRIRPNAYNISRMLVTAAVILSNVIQFGLNLSFHWKSSVDEPNLFAGELTAPLIQAVTFSFFLILIHLHRLNGLHTSALAWHFTFLTTLFSLPSVYTIANHLIYEPHNHHQFSFEFLLLTSVHLFGVFTLFTLTCFADRKPAEQNFSSAEENTAFVAPATDFEEEEEEFSSAINSSRRQLLFRSLSREEVADSEHHLLECPELRASFLSRLTYTWFDALARTGYRKKLELADLWQLRPEDKARYVGAQFARAWEGQKVRRSSTGSSSTPETAKPSALWALCRCFLPFYLYASTFQLASVLLSFVYPQLLAVFIDFVATPTAPSWHGYAVAVALLGLGCLHSVCFVYYLRLTLTIGQRVRNSLITAIYRKSLKLSPAARVGCSSGQITNLMSVDAADFVDLMTDVDLIWSAPLQVLLTLCFLWQELGPSVLAGVAVILALLPVNWLASKWSVKWETEQMETKDRRINLIQETLGGIKIIKLFGIERSFIERISEIRNRETSVLRKIALMAAVTSTTWSVAPFMVAFATFGTYIFSSPEHVLDAKKAFVSLTLLELLRFPMAAIPQMINQYVVSMVSIRRLNRYLNAAELAGYVSYQFDDGSGENIITLEGASFTWGKAEAVVEKDKDDEEEDGDEGEEGDGRDDGDKVPLITAAEEGDQSSSESSPESSPPLVLKNINLKIKRGSLVAIVGEVATGKSSLLSAILGDMELVEGSVRVNFGSSSSSSKSSTTIGYVAQQAWIRNASLRENILFGVQYDPIRYNKIVRICALAPDLDMLPAGDQTEIGEKGINLSGGQKQRISLARACYASPAAELFLLDDPLSAVDSHVAKHLFSQVLSSSTGYLRDKTRLLVTNAVASVLPEVDQIVVLGRGGVISEVGTYEELLQRGGPFSAFLKEHSGGGGNGSKTVEEGVIKRDLLQTVISTDDSHSSHSRVSSPALMRQSSKLEAEKFRLIDEEETEEGNVKWPVYLAYFRSLTLVWAPLMAIGFLGEQAFEMGTNVWLAAWSNDPQSVNGTSSSSSEGNSKHLRNERLLVYGLLGAGQAFFVLAGWVALTNGTVRSSISLHKGLLERVMRSPMAFFETTPLGRVVNRFSRDMDTVDTHIPYVIENWAVCFLYAIAVLLLIIVQLPLFAVIILPLFVFYFFIQRYYTSTSRQITRLESITRSPIFSFFGETLAGVSTIRAFGATKRAVAESNRRIDANQRTFYPEILANRWLALRLEFLGHCVSFFAAIFTVLKRTDFEATPAFAGLLMYYAMSVTDSMTWLVRNTSLMESAVVAVERILEYSKLPTEAPWRIGEKEEDVESSENTESGSSSWPEEGAITFENVSIKYREGLEPVLQNISLAIRPGEKVGVVGRTGAGKSTITLALFRILEPEVGGRIVIDGVDISTIGLHDLRSKLAIIPQDPILFAGTVRYNLDPLGSLNRRKQSSHSDEQFWEALERCHLKETVAAMSGGLDATVAENGSNLSVGERQLLCVARALLRRSKILVLDEATASVDLATDALVQATINEHLAGATVLTIAHRLHTVLHYDRILVLSEGRVAEFDTPQALLSTEGSLFAALAKDAGIV